MLQEAAEITGPSFEAAADAASSGWGLSECLALFRLHAGIRDDLLPGRDFLGVVGLERHGIAHLEREAELQDCLARLRLCLLYTSRCV